MHMAQQIHTSRRSGAYPILLRTSGLVVLLAAFVLTPSSFAQSSSGPVDMSGTWVDQSNAGDKLVLLEKGDKIQVREMDGDKVVADYTCNLNGAQCSTKEDGHSVNVMIYYNGSKLVEIKERGSDVEKRRFTLADDGKTMQVEVIPLSGEGKTSRRTYQKQDSEVAKSTT